MNLAARAARLSLWGRVVVACAVLVGAVAVALAAWSIASQEERRISYPVRGELTGLELDLGEADVLVVGGGEKDLSVEHVDAFGFGHGPETQRIVDGGVFRIRTRCPRTVLHGCSVRYRIAVPDNVPLTVRTTSGTVRLRGYRGSARVTTDGGDIDVRDFCGFSLQARAQGRGDVAATTVCPPPRMSLRTTSGSVRVAVPAARYNVDASTSGPAPVVRGITEAADAPFSIQALSDSGDVLVEGAR